MNVSTAEVLTENKRDFFVPTIVTTTPEKRKELDLTSVMLVQRRRAAIDYLESVEQKRNEKRKFIRTVKNAIGNVLAGISIFVMLYAMCIIGTLF